jgi:chromosome segregation ATPase
MTDTGPPPTREELLALQEQLADARSEVDRLSGEAASISTETAQLRGELEGARTAAEAEAQARREFADAAEARLRTAAERYRDLVVRTEPELPPEMIAGNDIDAVEASAAAAREVVERIRARIEGDRQIARIPAGAPPRGGPDVSALSPEQKIRLGLERRAS